MGHMLTVTTAHHAHCCRRVLSRAHERAGRADEALSRRQAALGSSPGVSPGACLSPERGIQACRSCQAREPKSHPAGMFWRRGYSRVQGLGTFSRSQLLVACTAAPCMWPCCPVSGGMPNCFHSCCLGHHSRSPSAAGQSPWQLRSWKFDPTA